MMHRALTSIRHKAQISLRTVPWAHRLSRNISALNGNSYGLTEEQMQLQDMANAFAENELLPYAKDWDEQKIFPIDTLRKAAQLGESFGSMFAQRILIKGVNR